MPLHPVTHSASGSQGSPGSAGDAAAKLATQNTVEGEARCGVWVLGTHDSLDVSPDVGDGLAASCNAQGCLRFSDIFATCDTLAIPSMGLGVGVFYRTQD